jgi:fructose-bisphosphate aldolase class II
MPIATPEVYADMIRRAKEGGFAYPAINCTSSETVNAALRGFADAGSDGIIQFSTGGAEFASGTKVKDMVTGAVALAEFAHVVAEKYPVNVALHTDHCPKDKLDGYVRPLIALSQDRVDAGQEPLFQSHMWDGSAIDLHENLQIAEELLERTAAAKIVLEVEIGVVGGEEDGVAHDINEKLYTAEGDFVATAKALGLGERGVYLLAATFGNVHGVYKPGNVKLRPEILRQGQDVVAKEFGLAEGSKPSTPTPSTRSPGRSSATCSPTTTACSRSTARSATRRPTTRARTTSWPRPAWPRASSRRARTCCRPVSRRAREHDPLAQPAR